MREKGKGSDSSKILDAASATLSCSSIFVTGGALVQVTCEASDGTEPQCSLQLTTARFNDNKHRFSSHTARLCCELPAAVAGSSNGRLEILDAREVECLDLCCRAVCVLLRNAGRLLLATLAVEDLSAPAAVETISTDTTVVTGTEWQLLDGPAVVSLSPLTDTRSRVLVRRQPHEVWHETTFTPESVCNQDSATLSTALWSRRPAEGGGAENAQRAAAGRAQLTAHPLGHLRTLLLSLCSDSNADGRVQLLLTLCEDDTGGCAFASVAPWPPTLPPSTEHAATPAAAAAAVVCACAASPRPQADLYAGAADAQLLLCAPGGVPRCATPLPARPVDVQLASVDDAGGAVVVTLASASASAADAVAEAAQPLLQRCVRLLACDELQHATVVSFDGASAAHVTDFLGTGRQQVAVVPAGGKASLAAVAKHIVVTDGWTVWGDGSAQRIPSPGHTYVLATTTSEPTAPSSKKRKKGRAAGAATDAGGGDGGGVADVGATATAAAAADGAGGDGPEDGGAAAPSKKQQKKRRDVAAAGGVQEQTGANTTGDGAAAAVAGGEAAGAAAAAAVAAAAGATAKHAGRERRRTARAQQDAAQHRAAQLQEVAAALAALEATEAARLAHMRRECAAKRQLLCAGAGLLAEMAEVAAVAAAEAGAVAGAREPAALFAPFTDDLVPLFSSAQPADTMLKQHRLAPAPPGAPPPQCLSSALKLAAATADFDAASGTLSISALVRNASAAALARRICLSAAPAIGALSVTSDVIAALRPGAAAQLLATARVPRRLLRGAPLTLPLLLHCAGGGDEQHPPQRRAVPCGSIAVSAAALVGLTDALADEQAQHPLPPLAAAPPPLPRRHWRAATLALRSRARSLTDLPSRLGALSRGAQGRLFALRARLAARVHCRTLATLRVHVKDATLLAPLLQAVRQLLPADVSITAHPCDADLLALAADCLSGIEAELPGARAAPAAGAHNTGGSAARSSERQAYTDLCASRLVSAFAAL